MATHALAVTGVGSTGAATKIQVGSDITFPAGGPWLIHHIWGQVARDTTIPDQGTGGILTIDSLSGDITPDPAPGKWPLIGSPIAESANAALSAVPLNMWEVDWVAAGKAVIKLSYTGLLAMTTADIVAAGVIFGDSRPVAGPMKFCDTVAASFASASEQTIGSITLAEKATRIVGILCDLNKGDASTTGEPVVATVRLDSQDMLFPPAQYPCNRAFNASDGTAVGQSAVAQSQFIPLDIPVVGGAIVNIFATTTQSITGNASVSVSLAYE